MTAVQETGGHFSASGAIRSRLHDRLLHGVLFVTILASPIVFVEPSPYEGLILVLAIAAISAGLRLPRQILPLLVLSLAWAAGGAASTLPVLFDPVAVGYLVTSFYLQMSAVLFACLVADEPLARLETMRRAYIIAAVVAAILGIAGYFDLIPGADFFITNSRARATFKDPNVFGPFLILPLLFVVQSMLYRGLRLHRLILGGIMLLGLFLSFSRGAWGHFAFSTASMVLLMLATSDSTRFRMRTIAIFATAAVLLAMAISVLASLDAVSSMFHERAALVQSYDEGYLGRFGRHEQGFLSMFEYWNGVGPKRFWTLFVEDPHNVYLNAFYSYGWLGGIAYLTLTALTLVYGFRALVVRTPWQPYFIAIYATFAGLACEAAIIDTDHWRHFFLLLGLIWGLIAATTRARAAMIAGVEN